VPSPPAEPSIRAGALTSRTGYRALPVLLGLSAVLVAPATVAAQHVRGTVVAAESGQPIAQARVTIALEDESAPDVVGLTGRDGSFSFRAPGAGAIRLYVEQFGFRSWSSQVIEIGRDEEITISVELPIRAIELDEIEVEVTSRGDERGRSQFARRRAESDNSRVTFLDPVHIALANPRHPAELFRNVPGIILEYDDRMVPLIGRCLVVYLDHIRVPVMGVNVRLNVMAFGGVDRLSRIISQRDIRGIEIYPNYATIPRELRDGYRRTGCALVQIWTTIGW
jgi:hypothetical protein